MAQVSITDFFVPDDRLTQVLDLLSDASAASGGEGSPEFTPQPNIRVDKAVAEAEDIAYRSVLAPDAESADFLRYSLHRFLATR